MLTSTTRRAIEHIAAAAQRLRPKFDQVAAACATAQGTARSSDDG